MDDKVRVEDANIELVSVLILITFFVANLKIIKLFTIVLNLEKISQK